MNLPIKEKIKAIKKNKVKILILFKISNSIVFNYKGFLKEYQVVKKQRDNL